MSKARRNHHRENRIREEIIVDAYGRRKRSRPWAGITISRTKIQFPFHARNASLLLQISPLRKGDSVEIRKMAPEDSCSSDMLT